MNLTSRKRMEYALNFKEADRVPIEMRVPAHLHNHPKAQNLVALADAHADVFAGIPDIDWGLLGLPAKKVEEPLPPAGGFNRKRITYITSVGEFSGVWANDPENPGYYGWEEHLIQTFEDFQRFASAEFPPIAFPKDYKQRLNEHCGEKTTPHIILYHPFGGMARNTHPQEFYPWLLMEPDVVHSLFQKQYAQINDLIHRLQPNCTIYFTALEMAVPPWMGKNTFDEFIFPYDQKMNESIHRYGGLVRHHSHDKIFNFLEHWADMGIDSIEPLEMPPAGDTDLAKAKALVGGRMSLAGNIPSQRFIDMSNEEIEQLVKNAIRDAAKGGGFILKCASTGCGLNSYKTEEQLEKLLAATECFLRAGLRYGCYE